MNSIATSAEKSEAACIRARRADLADVAVSVLGLSESTATRMSLDDLTARFAVDGFDEEGLLQDLVDNRGYHPMGVNELCLSSMISLWIESIQPDRRVRAAKKAASPAAIGGKTDRWAAARMAPKTGVCKTVRGLVSEGIYTRQQIIAAALTAHPAAKKSTVTTMLSDLRNPKYNKNTLAVVRADGIYTFNA